MVEAPNGITSKEEADNDILRLDIPNFDKLTRDLQEGFRFSYDTPEWGNDNEVYVVTRHGDDLFVVEIHNRNWQSFPDEPLSSIYDCYVRRKKLLRGAGSASMEVFSYHSRTDRPDEIVSNYRVQANKGGDLSEEEFWREYNGSLPDPDLNKEFYNIIGSERRKNKPRKLQFSMTWIVEDAKMNTTDIAE